MARYVAFLRAVNVGGRFYKMADLRDCLTASGLADVETYIQSGNVRLTTRMRSRERVARHVEEALEAGCGFPVPTIVLTPEELTAVYDEATSVDLGLTGDVRRYVTFLKADPPADGAAAVDAWDHEGERAKVVGRAVHVWLTKPSHEAKFSNARFERSLGVATTRDLKVVTALAQRWGA